ncbi:hypothetical protein [Salinirussus salinus]|nr:hypothetical protein [Salinirussus salinus]
MSEANGSERELVPAHATAAVRGMSERLEGASESAGEACGPM